MDYRRWSKVHGGTHVTMIKEAGGFLYLICETCSTAQRLEDVVAGLDVDAAVKASGS